MQNMLRSKGRWMIEPAIVPVLAVVTAIGLFSVAHAQFEDDFGNPNWEERWEIHDDGTEGAPSQWFVGPGGGLPEGAFGTTTNILRGGGPSKEDEQAGAYALLLDAASRDWTNYTLSVDMFHMDNDYAGLFVRYVDELNYFRVWTKQEEVDIGNATSYGMEKVVKGKWTLFFGPGGAGPQGDGLTGDAIPNGVGNVKQREWFNVSVDVQGDTVTMFMKGKEIDSVQDKDLAPGGPLEKGTIALYNSTNPMAYDEVMIIPLAVEASGKLSTTWGNLKTRYGR